ncbi:Uncharacterised protein [Mycobacterium tuberculosis]|nr:Uncharacterised protein [Mycobacterium tuberculosis]
MSQPRSVGKPVTASRPPASRSQNSSAVDAPPGKRQVMPTIAIGSSATCAVAGTSTARRVPPGSSSRRCSASSRGLGWSKTTVADSGRPSAACRPLRSSTAVSESKPRYLKVRSASTLSALACRRIAAACVRTSVSSSSSCVAGSRPARRVTSDASPLAAVTAPPAAARRGALRTRDRSSGGTGSRVRATAALKRSGTSTGDPLASAVSRRSSPCSTASGTASRCRRLRSLCASRPPMPSCSSQSPQARDVAGRPRAWRHEASPSRYALPAA